MSTERLFSVLKYILIVVNVLFIIGCLFVLIIGMELIEAQPENKKYHSKYKSLGENALIFIVLMSIALFSVGIIGAVKAHLPLTLTYAILMTIYVVLCPFASFTAFLFHIFITGCAYLYAALINRNKKTQAATQESQLDKI